VRRNCGEEQRPISRGSANAGDEDDAAAPHAALLRDTRREVSRRDFLGKSLSGVFALSGALGLGSALHHHAVSGIAAGAPTSARGFLRRAPSYLRDDDAFLGELSRRAFRYFWEQADPNTGLIRDRAPADGRRPGPAISSIAATGFGLTALPIAAERGWIAPRQARARAIATLEFFARAAAHEHGWFYHFLDLPSGRPARGSEVSSVDTALLLAGILTVGQAFSDDSHIAGLARAIYDRVDFRWMLAGDARLLSFGWRPGSGFLPQAWDTYCEQTILYLLAIGSRSSAIPADSWQAIRRPWVEAGGFRYVAGAKPLFIHQYSHAWVDYRGLRDSGGERLNYFENSMRATQAHRAFCTQLSKRYADYGPDDWGITASDSPEGYIAWGGPPVDSAIDGTVVPCAAAGSLMFMPEICIADLRAMVARHESDPRVWGPYGLADAFNPLTGWASSWVLGIDQGITLLSAENARSTRVWDWFMRNPEPRRAMQLAGLVPDRVMA
jgi:hypothetical protein